MAGRPKNNAPCDVRDCDKAPRAHGLCVKHLKRWQAGKRLEDPKSSALVPPAERRSFTALVTKDRLALFDAESERLGYANRTALVTEILMTWEPPKGKPAMSQAVDVR